MIKNIFIFVLGLLFIVGCESVTIPAEVQAPIANDDNVQVERTKSIVIPILNNDKDVDGNIDITSVKIVTNVSHGQTTLAKSSGKITYVSDANFTGNDVFTYQVKDNNGALSNVATVTIQVKQPVSTISPTPVPTSATTIPTPVPVTNTRPIAYNDNKVLTVATSIVIKVLENDKALRGILNKKSVFLTKQAIQGKAYVSVTEGTITYVAHNSYIGNDFFTYRVRDSYGMLSNEAIVKVTVKEVQNKVPVATNDSVKLDGVNTLEINVLDNDSDSDGSLIPSSIEIVSDVTYGVLDVNSSTGLITYTSNNSYTGIDTFTYKVKDNNGAYSNIATVEIDVVSLRLLKSDGIEEKAKEWYVRIVVEDTTNNMKTAGTQLGQLDTADVVTKHTLKAIAPFRPTYLDVVFKNPADVDAGEYKSNFHESSTNADSWEFTVKSHDNNATMILSWRGLYVLTPYTDTEGREQYNEYRSLRNPLLPYMTIIDTASNEELKVIENSEVQTYVFRMDGATERTFRWELKDSSIPLASPLLATVPTEYKAKLKKLEVKVLRKDAKATPDSHKKKRVDSIDMLTPPIFKVLVK